MTTFNISSAKFYGDVTQEKADEYADLICAAASKQFPAVTFNVCRPVLSGTVNGASPSGN